MRISFFAGIVTAFAVLLGSDVCHGAEALVVFEKKITGVATVVVTKRSGDEDAGLVTLPPANVLPAANGTANGNGAVQGAALETGNVATLNQLDFDISCVGPLPQEAKKVVAVDEAAPSEGTVVQEIVLKRTGAPDESLWLQKTFAKNAEDAPKVLSVAMGERTGAVLYVFRNEVRVRTFGADAAANGNSGGEERVLGRWAPGMKGELIVPVGEGQMRAELEWKGSGIEAGKPLRWVWTLGQKEGMPAWIYAPVETKRMQELRAKLTPLMKRGENFAEVKKLIEQEKELVDICDDQGRTLLMFMATEGDLPAVKYLVKNGAQVNKKDFDGRDALGYAVKNSRLEMMQFLTAHGADVNAANDDGTTELQLAAIYATPEVVQWLIKRTADMNGRDLDGRNAIYHAVEKHRVDTMAALLELGADVISRDIEGETVLSVAKADGNEEVLAVLKKAGKM